jgi:hypothetical protein
MRNISNTAARTSNLTSSLEGFADAMDNLHEALGFHEAGFYNQMEYRILIL